MEIFTKTNHLWRSKTAILIRFDKKNSVTVWQDWFWRCAVNRGHRGATLWLLPAKW